MIPSQASQATILPQAFHTMTPRDPNGNMNTGASSHLADNTVRQFTRDNDVSVEFDAYGFLVKDYQSGRLLLRCDSTGDLYPITQQPSSQTLVVLLSFSSTTWHRRLGHPGDDVLHRLESRNLISCRKSKLFALCHACQLGKHAKLPFYNSESSVDSVFEIIHSDVWTSPILSESGIKYYAIFLDHFSHFVWVYPLHKKSDLFDNFVSFRAYVNKQFNADIKALQCDHGGEYDNTRFHDLRNRMANPSSLAVSRDWPIHQLDVKNAFFMITYLRLFICINLLALFVDDIILIASSSAFLQRIIASLYSEFAMTDLEEILEQAHMQNCNPCRTPVDTESKLGSDGDPVCLYMHDPRDPHCTALKGILRYVRGTLDYGPQLHVSSTTQLSAYTDAD
ncbi:ribonuclease H-like domain-containing protein [Tanacetum coccineum]